MFNFLMPDYCFNKFYDVELTFLQSINVKGILLDIDNTLEPYENAEPTERVVEWLNSLIESGIKVAIVSNNNKERVETFNKSLGLVCFYKAKKPFKKNLMLAMKKIETEPTNTVFMGDQIFTDVWAAKNAGLRAILVPPIKDKTDLFTKFKRLLEKPILKKFRKKHGE